MKTKEQIIEWLKSHALYDAFAKNISPITVEEEAKKRGGIATVKIEWEE